MDCLRLYTRSKSTDGNYWINAVKFTVCNISIGIDALRLMDSRLRGTIPNLETHSISTSERLKKIRIEMVTWQF
jgi:hypothetical protein